MAKANIDLGYFESKTNEDCNILESLYEEYSPIQQKRTLFKFLLYTAKVEIKVNSLQKMIYQASLYEMGIWFVGFLLFISNPSQLFYIWFLVFHLPRSTLGFMLLRCMPKTYEIFEQLAQNPNLDEENIITMLKTQIRESFIIRWNDHKLTFLFYLIATLVCTTIDLITLIAIVVIFGKDNYILMEICLLFVTIALLSNIMI